MPVVNDGVTELPGDDVPAVSVPVLSVSKESEDGMGPDDYGLLKMHALNGAQRQSDGAGHYAENLRYDYLEGKNNQSVSEGLGYRVVTESGSGRTRAETNRPAATGAASAT